VCDDADTDEDCDGLADDDDSSVASAGMSTWYADADADGYGTSTASTSACDVPAGYGEGTDDCDDTNAAINPAATEVCGDAVDDDCDGMTSCDTTVSDADVSYSGVSSGPY